MEDGADTFLVLYRARDSAAAERRAEELGLCLRPPIDYRGVQLRVGCRLGLALFPLHGGTATELLQRADIALAESKRSGARLSVFVPGAEQDHRRRIELLGELQRAISGDELELFYQPKVTARERAVVGCEALIRWRHPVRGYVRPAEFIPQAERAGSIREVTRWVVDHALAQLARWHAEGRALDLAVNLSAADLASPSFAAWIAARIVESGAPAGRLVLEVTESAAMHELPRALAAMDQLRVLGVRFSIDDFGTGYSSLAQLKQLPVDELKIDRAFIRDLDGAGATDQIVRATVQMGHALGLKVVAEGVEDEAGAAAVTALGCDLIQGYLITAALPIAEFEAWLQRPTSSPSITSDSDAANLTQGSVSGSARAVLR